MAGLFIAFEGGEGAGKTTQAGLLQERLKQLDIPCDLFREPGGTELGEYLRTYLKSDRPLSSEAELLLFEAARVELMVNRVRPSLESGRVVIADRFSASTVAYQGHGRGLDLDFITFLNGFATLDIRPNVIFLLDLEPIEGLKRIEGYQMAFVSDLTGDLYTPDRNEEGRRFEDLSLEFHNKVRQGFIFQAQVNTRRWKLINAARSKEEVSEDVWRHVEKQLRAD